ncbi:MAG: DUF4167 domain-containing protein [Rhizobiales bacterium]|nr:DUF4167 domain-containing protein [Hyphomicrobiales bacterium]
MRPGQNNFKNRNRNRNRNRHSGGGGGSGGGNPGNRVLDSNGPDVKLRGTPQTIAEKYMQLARDAASSGDRVMAESYYQHADHYYRLWLAAQPAGQPIQFPRRLDEDVEDLEPAEADDDAAETVAEGAEGGETAPAEGAAAEGEAAPGEDSGQGQARPFRSRDNREGGRDQGNRDQQGGRFRNRWPRRGDRNAEPREGAAPAEAVGDEGDRAERPERPERPERNERPERAERAPRRDRNADAAPAAESGGDWEAPSFLKRPVPAVSSGSDAETPEASPPERRPRARRPRYGEEGVTPNEPVTGDE